MQFFLSSKKRLTLALISSLAFPALAEVQIIESTSTAQLRQQSQQQAWANAAKQLFQEIEGLREEVIRLNGQVEEQTYQIDQLKQQQLDNYVDLDKRVAALSVAADSVPADAAAVSEENIVDDKVAYKAAYALVQERKFDEAKEAFKAFINTYAKSNLLANAWFWLGGLHGLDKEYGEAEAAYNTVIADFPEHRKTPEAMYKIGTLYYQQDKKASAKQMMLDLVKAYENDSSHEKQVRMAREFLRKHFP